MEQTQRILINDVLRNLKRGEQNILKLYYWAGFTEGEIAEFLEVSQPRIHQIKQRALTKCRIQLTEEKSMN